MGGFRTIITSVLLLARLGVPGAEICVVITAVSLRYLRLDVLARTISVLRELESLEDLSTERNDETLPVECPLNLTGESRFGMRRGER